MRNRKIHVQFWLNENEAAVFNEKVKRSRIGRSAYLREAIINSVIKEAPPVDVPRLIMEVRRVGITLNEILRIAQSNGLVDVPRLRKALEENRDVELFIFNAYLGSDSDVTCPTWAEQSNCEGE